MQISFHAFRRNAFISQLMGFTQSDRKSASSSVIRSSLCPFKGGCGMSAYQSVCTGHRVTAEECLLNMSHCTGSTSPPECRHNWPSAVLLFVVCVFFCRWLFSVTSFIYSSEMCHCFQKINVDLNCGCDSETRASVCQVLIFFSGSE